MPGILVVEDDENLNRGITFSPPIEVGVISQLIYIVNKERCICYARYTRG